MVQVASSRKTAHAFWFSARPCGKPPNFSHTYAHAHAHSQVRDLSASAALLLLLLLLLSSLPTELLQPIIIDDLFNPEEGDRTKGLSFDLLSLNAKWL